MSTVKATNLQHASSSSVNAVTTSGGDLTNAAGVSFMGGSKNLLHNGACQIAQRNTSVASITTQGYYTADRWQLFCNTLGTWTQSIENDAPTGSGLRKSLRMLCTTADASPAGDDWLFFEQALEGQDLQRIAKGTASAQQLTLSFWVKSNRTGTYVVNLTDADNGREVAAQYTVSASATWEKKTITFPADTTGAFDNDNAGSLAVRFGLAIGSNRSSGTLPSTWQSSVTANLFVGQTNLAAATNNYWQITGVQLEVGPVATSFEFKSYGQELRECQRYYFRVSGSAAGDVTFANGTYFNATTVRGVMHFPVSMRIGPSLSCTNSSLAFAFGANNGNDEFDTISNLFNPTQTSALLGVTSGVSGTAGQAGYFTMQAGATRFVAFDAEL